MVIVFVKQFLVSFRVFGRVPYLFVIHFHTKNIGKAMVTISCSWNARNGSKGCFVLLNIFIYEFFLIDERIHESDWIAFSKRVTTFSKVRLQ